MLSNSISDNVELVKVLSGPVFFVMTYFIHMLVYTYEHKKYRSKGIYVVSEFSLCRDKILGKSHLPPKTE